MILRKKGISETEGGSTRSYCVENWLWKRLLTYRETEYGKNEYQVTTGYKELIQSSQSYKVSFR